MNDAHPTIRGPQCSELNRRVEAFESSGERGTQALMRFLPPRTDPLYLPVLCELVRIDLEMHSARGEVRALESYRDDFPELFDDPSLLRSLIAEERRLRPDSDRPSTTDLRMRRPAADCNSRTAAVPVLLFAPDLEGAEPALPGVGDEFLGFQLDSELGRGSFASVFLARQKHLADRPVALKITTRPSPEPQRLARLQHTNIVPIHSVHNEPPFQALCMPYFGKTTLADVLRSVRGQPSLPASGSGLFSTLRSHPTGGSSEPQIALPPTPAEAPQPIRDKLAGMSYADAVVWIGAQIADGLAHAHERGILHRDLKPANVLLSDDGQPMLLDFNLAAEARAPGDALMGGTVPYMAPEQMEAVAGRRGIANEQSDLFSLGVVLFELLTGRLPFPLPDRGPFDLDAMIALRRAGAPRLRSLNPAVSPAVEAVVRKLLHPEPAKRYADARQLQLDLDGHLHDLPMQHAANPSLRERVNKWLRRHPRTLPIGALVAAVVVVIGLSVGYASQAAARLRGDALRQADYFSSVLPGLRLDLNSPGDPMLREEAARRARVALAAFGLPDDPNWRERSVLRALPPERRQRLEGELGEALVLLTESGWRFDETHDLVGLLRLNRLAETLFPHGAPPLLWRQRAALVGGDADAEKKSKAEPENARAQYLDAVDLISTGRFRDALPLLERLTSREPGHAAAQFALAYCCHMLGMYDRALERYEVPRSLQPDDPRPSHNRGLIYLLLKRYAEAERELDETIRLDPEGGDAYKSRGLARLRQGNYDAAVDDFTAALDKGAPKLQVHLFRAQAYEGLKKAVEARRDREEAARCEPVREGDFLARATSRLPKDPEGALKDVEAAEAKNPRSIVALMNHASILSEALHRTEDSVKVLERLIGLYPDFAPARTGKAVLLARQGKRDEAHREAREALARSKQPVVYYQLACVFALTMKDNPADRTEALAHFQKALQAGHQDFFAYFDKDPDLDNLRGDKEFDRLLEAAKTLHAPQLKP